MVKLLHFFLLSPTFLVFLQENIHEVSSINKVAVIILVSLFKNRSFFLLAFTNRWNLSYENRNNKKSTPALFAGLENTFTTNHLFSH